MNHLLFEFLTSTKTLVGKRKSSHRSQLEQPHGPRPERANRATEMRRTNNNLSIAATARFLTMLKRRPMASGWLSLTKPAMAMASVAVQLPQTAQAPTRTTVAGRLLIVSGLALKPRPT